MISIILLQALFINWLLMLPAYQNILTITKLNRKPMNCSYCLSFWLNIVLAIVCWSPAFIILAVTTPVLSVIIERILGALPIKF
jgi:hypothetical protein